MLFQVLDALTFPSARSVQEWAHNLRRHKKSPQNATLEVRQRPVTDTYRASLPNKIRMGKTGPSFMHSFYPFYFPCNQQHSLETASNAFEARNVGKTINTIAD